MKLNDFRLLINDFAASFHFWHEIVGLSTIFRDENNIYAELDAGTVRLELLKADYFAASFDQQLVAKQAGLDVSSTGHYVSSWVSAGSR